MDEVLRAEIAERLEGQGVDEDSIDAFLDAVEDEE